MRGLWMILVPELLKTKFAVAGGMVTRKSLAVRLLNLLSVIVLGAVLAVGVVVVPVVVVVVVVPCRAVLALAGGEKPQRRRRWRVSCMTTTSMTTSGLALSMSVISFSAKAT